MSNAYEKINNFLSSKVRDLSFPSSLLDELSEEERKDVESRIIKHCLLGDDSCFQYIDKLQFYDPIQIFVEENMSRLQPFSKTVIFKKLFELTQDSSYLSKMVNISKSDINSYSMLTLMFQDDNFANDDKNKNILSSLKEIAEQSDETYKNIYNSRIGNNDSTKPKVF